MKSVNDLKNFVANDLRDLKQQHKSLSMRKLKNIFICSVSMNVSLLLLLNIGLFVKRLMK